MENSQKSSIPLSWKIRKRWNFSNSLLHGKDEKFLSLHHTRNQKRLRNFHFSVARRDLKRIEKFLLRCHGEKCKEVKKFPLLCLRQIIFCLVVLQYNYYYPPVSLFSIRNHRDSDLELQRIRSHSHNYYFFKLTLLYLL